MIVEDFSNLWRQMTMTNKRKVSCNFVDITNRCWNMNKKELNAWIMLQVPRTMLILFSCVLNRISFCEYWGHLYHWSSIFKQQHTHWTGLNFSLQCFWCSMSVNIADHLGHFCGLIGVFSKCSLFSPLLTNSGILSCKIPKKFLWVDSDSKLYKNALKIPISWPVGVFWRYS